MMQVKCAIFLLVLVVCNAFSLSSSRQTFSRMTMSDRKPLMGGNWKLNPTTVSDSVALAAGLAKLCSDVKDVDILIFPPTTVLFPVKEALKGTNIMVGGQNCYHQDSGAYTGATSTCMLKDLGMTYVLVGHSERRSLFFDNDAAINKKVIKVLNEGLKPVLCIGESREEYEAGLNHEVCAIQIMKDLKGVTAEQMAHVVLAYEPVWAIGTGLVCPKEVAQEVHCFIRSLITKKYGEEVSSKTIIQYGGSVNPGNVKELMAMPDIDGCLVGGASLTADSFFKIATFNR
jgi:triosephosphate isomerase